MKVYSRVSFQVYQLSRAVVTEIPQVERVLPRVWDSSQVAIRADELARQEVHKKVTIRASYFRFHLPLLYSLSILSISLVQPHRFKISMHRTTSPSTTIATYILIVSISPSSLL